MRDTLLIKLGEREMELLEELVKKNDNKKVLEALRKLEESMAKKLSEIKADIASAARNAREAFAELSSKLVALQTQIDELIAGASDPDVTDEAFLADLETVKTDLQSLADIVPNAATTTTEATTETTTPAPTA